MHRVVTARAQTRAAADLVADFEFGAGFLADFDDDSGCVDAEPDGEAADGQEARVGDVAVPVVFDVSEDTSTSEEGQRSVLFWFGGLTPGSWRRRGS